MLYSQENVTREVDQRKSALNTQSVQPRDYFGYAVALHRFFPDISSRAQIFYDSNFLNNGKQFLFEARAGLGIGVYDNGTLYYEFALNPVFRFGKFHIALLAELRIDSKGNLRLQDWNQGIISYLRILDYIQYGDHTDPYFIRIQHPSRITIGSGSIVNMYTNSVAYDLRKPGLSFEVRLSFLGIQGLVGEFTQAAVYASRLYVKPLQSINIFPFNELEIGGTFAIDVRKEGAYVSRTGQRMFTRNDLEEKENVSVIAADLAIPVFSLPFWGLRLSVDYAQFVGFGSGVSAGVINTFTISNSLHLSVRFEHRESFGRFAFGYFNNLYEVNRYQEINGMISTSLNTLSIDTEPWRAFRALAAFNIFGKFIVAAGYESRYDSHIGSNFYVTIEAPTLLDNLEIKGEYFKEGAAFNLSLFELNSSARARLLFTYRAFGFLALELTSQWMFREQVSEANNVAYTPYHNFLFRVYVSIRL